MHVETTPIPVRVHLGSSGAAYVKFDAVHISEDLFKDDFSASVRTWVANRGFWKVDPSRAADVAPWLAEMQADADDAAAHRARQEVERAEAEIRGREAAVRRAEQAARHKAAIELRDARRAELMDEMRCAETVTADLVDRAALTVIAHPATRHKYLVDADRTQVVSCWWYREYALGGYDYTEETSWRRVTGPRAAALADEIQAVWE